MSENQNDLIHLAMQRAVELFGGSDDIFNAACFSQSLRKLAGLGEMIDGQLVTVILCGRTDVIPLAGGSHFRFLPNIITPKPARAE